MIRSETRWGLRWKLSSELREEKFLGFVGHGVTRKDQRSAIGGWKMDIEHLNGFELF